MILEPTREAAFDNAATAGLYSQLTGVLAGFAFAGLVLIVTHRLDRGGPAPAGAFQRATDSAVALLFSAFVGLVLTSLSYAVIAGETAAFSRAAVEHVVAGAGFGAATMVLLLALLELLTATAPALGGQLRAVAGVILPIVVMVYVYGGVYDVADRLSQNWLKVSGLVAVGLLVVVLGAARLLPRVAGPVPVSNYLTLSAIGLSLPLISSLAVPVISTSMDADHVSSAPVYVALVLTLLFTSSLGIFCAVTR